MIEKFWILWQRSLSINSYRVYKTAGSWSSRSYKSTAVLHCEWNSTSNCMSIHTVWLPKTACISGETKKRSPSAAGDRTKVVNQTHKAGWRQSWKREEFTVLKESTGDKSTEGKKKEKKKGSDPEDGCEGAARKKEPIGSCHREGNTARGSKGERERGREKAFLKRGRGGPFFCWGSATVHSSGRKQSLVLPTSVITLSPSVRLVDKLAVMNHLAPLPMSADKRCLLVTAHSNKDLSETCSKEFYVTLKKKKEPGKNKIKQITVIWPLHSCYLKLYICVCDHSRTQQASLVRAWQTAAATTTTKSSGCL